MPPSAIPRATSRAEPVARVELFEWLGFALLALAAAALALLRPDKAIDFHVYYLNARHYFSGAPMYGPDSGTGWAGGVYRYPPIFLDLFRPLTLLPLPAAAAMWAAGQLLAGGALLIALRRRWGLRDAAAFWPAMLLLAPYFIQELRYGNAQFYVVAMVMAAFVTERPLARGFWLGWAAALKVWPLFFLPCLLARRRWRAAGAMAAWAAGWTLLPALWRGWGQQLKLLGQWLAQERGIAALSATAGELWYPGQSLHDVLARYLRIIDYARLQDARYPQIAWLHLSAVAFDRLWWILAVVLTVALLLFLARAAGERDALVAFMFCALMVLEPHVHRLILVTLLWPALWLCAQWARGRLRGGPRSLTFWFWLAFAAAVLEPLVPGAGRQRVMQAYGVDFFLVVLPFTGMTAWWALGQRAYRASNGLATGAGQSTLGLN
ncbi:MAG: glycosyltransferase family 87 protein [Terriglobales bacterium]